MTNEQSRKHMSFMLQAKLGRSRDRQLSSEIHLGQERRFQLKGRIYVRDAQHLKTMLALEEESIYSMTRGVEDLEKLVG
jgi:hypothetical protein